MLGNAHRGFLFERNAFLTVSKNLDEEHYRRLMPAVWLTLVHRTQTLLVQNNLGGELLTLDPYAGHIANTASPRPGEASEPQLFDGGTGGLPELTLAEKWRGYGAKEFLRRAVRKAARRLLPSFVFDEPAGPTLTDARTVAQLRALTWLLGHQEATAAARREVQAQRRRGDGDYFRRFPPVVVATYPGDAELFASTAFADALGELAVARHELEELMVFE